MEIQNYFFHGYETKQEGYVFMHFLFTGIGKERRIERNKKIQRQKVARKIEKKN